MVVYLFMLCFSPGPPSPAIPHLLYATPAWSPTWTWKSPLRWRRSGRRCWTTCPPPRSSWAIWKTWNWQRANTASIW